MRSIFHEILARYLGSDQYAFEATSRELWPVHGYVPLTAKAPETQAADPEGNTRSRRELEPQACH
jgi:hypothetical protein